MVTAVSMGKFVRKTEFRISKIGEVDRWVRLKRASAADSKSNRGKGGLFFYPTRKVMFLDHKKHVIL